MNNCATCGHTRKEHCKAGTVHVEWKSTRAQNGGEQKTVTCVSDHCNQVLCSCVAYREAA